MNKTLFIVGTYINSLDIHKITYECVEHIKKFDIYDVMVVSHKQIPLDIQQISNYCFYDDRNARWTGEELENKIHFYFNVGNLFIKNFDIKTYIPGVYYLTFPITFAKNLGYEYVVYIDYDHYITDNKEIEECINIFENGSKDCIVYSTDNEIIPMYTGIHMYNLKSFNFNHFTQDLNLLKEKYLKQTYIVSFEYFYYENFIKPSNYLIRNVIKWADVAKEDTFLVPGVLNKNRSTLHKHKNEYVLYILDNKLYFWTQNNNDKVVYYNIITNENTLNLNVKKHVWYNLAIIDNVNKNNLLVIKTIDNEINDVYQINSDFIHKIKNQTTVDIL